MRCRSFVLAFNAISILIFFLLLSYTMHVEGRPVPQGHSFEWEKGVTLNIRQARSGPSNRGRESDIYTDSLNQTRKLYDAYAVKNVGETLSSYNMNKSSPIDFIHDINLNEMLGFPPA
ncbi:hypothetical protein Peur_073721 [Populus x canadensis]